MNIQTKLTAFQSENRLDVAFDVGKDRLYFYGEIPGPGNAVDCFQDDFANRNEAVIDHLQRLNDFATQRGLQGLRIICEPTGGFERRLLRFARKAGHRTAYVNTESVSKAQVIESNDSNKTDLKDPKTIFLLAKMGKVLTHRALEGDWMVLREYNTRVERLEARTVELKNRIYRLLRHLFCEISFKKDWLFNSQAAQLVVEAYGLNPYRMVQSGDKSVRDNLLRLGVKNKTISRLLSDAKISVLQDLDPDLLAFYEDDLRYEFEQLKDTQQHMAQTRIAMVRILDRLIEKKQVRITPQTGLISSFMLARIIGETGPLDDFQQIQQLYRYAGMNIRQRRSGTFCGQDKLSKKGRPILRKLLNQAVLPRITKKGLFGDYYHRKKDKGMIGPKATVAVARKFLKMLFGLQRSEQPFNSKRVFTSKNDFNIAA
jgi:transposase